MSVPISGTMRDHGATFVVSALSTLFAATLILGTGVLTAALDPRLIAESGTFRLMLLMISVVFIVIALYVGAVVTSNTFSTVIAGRTRTIALYRLIGATATRVRARIAAEGLIIGLLGSAAGFVLAEVVVAVITRWGPGWGWLPAGRDYPLVDPLALAAVAIVSLTTWAAAWSGSRRVTQVSPVEAIGASIERRADEARSRTARTVWAWIVIGVGAAFIALGLLMSLTSPVALLVSFFGGLISFTGILIGAHVIMPPLLRLSGRLVDRGPAGAIAAANAVQYPERSARSTVGLVIGVTLVTMFAVALESYRAVTLEAFAGDANMAAALDQTFAITTAVFTGLVGFSAIIAAVGMANTLSLSVLQRTRELGLLRALGLTGRQVRRMVLAVAAAAAPARRAIRVSPVAALAAD